MEQEKKLPDYTVEEILAEAQRLKQQRQQRGGTSAEVLPVVPPAVSPAAQKRAASMPKAVQDVLAPMSASKASDEKSTASKNAAVEKEDGRISAVPPASSAVRLSAKETVADTEETRERKSPSVAAMPSGDSSPEVSSRSFHAEESQEKVRIDISKAAGEEPRAQEGNPAPISAQETGARATEKKALSVSSLERSLPPEGAGPHTEKDTREIDLAGISRLEARLPKARKPERPLAAEQRRPITAPEADTPAPPFPDESEEVKIYVPANARKASATEAAPDAAHLADTKVIPLTPQAQAPTAVRVLLSPDASPAPVPEPAVEGQMTLEELVDDRPEEAGEDAPAPTLSIEERLRQVRQAMVEDFNFQKENEYNGFKFSGEEEENDPQEEPETFEDEVLDEYTSPDDADAVRAELAYRRRTGWFSLTITALFEGLLLWMLLLTLLSGHLPLDAAEYVSLNALFLLTMLLVQHRLIGSGLRNAFRLRADADSAVAVGAVVALLHTVLQYFHLEGVTGLTPILSSVGGMSLLFGALGRQLRILRAAENFRFVSHPEQPYAAMHVDDEETAAVLGRGAVPIGVPEVTYFRKTGFLTHFLEISYAEDLADYLMGVFVPGCFGVSLAVAVIYGLLHGSFWNGLTVFAALLCLCLPATAALAVNLPLWRTAKRLLRRGAMLSGWTAVEEFGRTNALTVDAITLFPNECVLLHGIKTFSGTRIDEAILAAAAVSIRAGGPLSHVFRRVIADKEGILPAVDTLVYEQDMGLSGWVGGRRVLIGSRRLMVNHGIDVPSKDYENRYKKDNRQLVYLSLAGELSGMFVISYVPDPGIAAALRELARREITLLIHTCDPNITEELLSEVYGLNPAYIEVLSASAGRAYTQLLEQPAEEQPAVMATNGRLEGMASLVAACDRLRVGGRISAVLQIVLGALGFLAGAMVAFFAGEAVLAVTPLICLGFMAGGLLLTGLSSLLHPRL